MSAWTGRPAGFRSLLRTPRSQYGLALALVAAALGLRFALEPWLQGRAPFITFFLPILFVAWFCGVGATLLTVGLSLLASLVLIVPPRLSFEVSETSDLVALGLFLAVSAGMVALSRWAGRARRAAEEALDDARRAQRGARIAVWDFDLGSRSLRSDELATLFGVDPATDREAMRALVHPDDLAESTRRLEQAIRDGAGYTNDFRVRHPELGERWFSTRAEPVRDARGQVLGFSGVTLDVTDRKRAEVAQALVASIVASSDDAIVAKGLDGIVRSWNAGAERVFGWTAEEMIGRSIETVIPAERRSEEADILSRLARGERIEHFETERVRKDGRRIDVSLTISPIRDESGRIVAASKIARDVTERRSAESRVAQQREWLRVTLRSIGDAVIACDRDTRITFMNPVAEELTGWGEAEAVGRPIGEVFRIVSEDTGEALEDPAAQVLRSASVVDLVNHTELVARDGRRIPIADSAAPIVDAEGTVLGVVLVFHDMIRQRRAEAALAEQREWFETTLRSIGDAVIATDEEGRIHFMNPVAEELTGWTLDEGRGRECEEVFRVVDERDRRPVESPLRRVLEDGAVYALANHSLLVARDGTELPVEDSGAPIRRGDGAIAGAVLVFRDVTARRRLDEERASAAREREQLLESERNARGEAERANRMKDEFVATLSHELRTPLNAILGWTQLLRAQAPDTDTLVRGLDVIQRNARVQAQLVSDLLDMSRILSGKMRLELERVDLSGIVSSACDALRSAADGKRIRLDCTFEGDVGPIVADPSRLQQVVWNLLSNAIKFTPKDGRVEVRVGRADGQAEIAVHDNGTGIPPDVLPLLFQRFRQADSSLGRRYGGLGLGLAIVKQLVELHGGEVRAESAGEGRGASFYVRLPLAESRLDSEVPSGGSDADGDEPAEMDESLLAGLEVLVVEDEPDTLELVRRLLADRGARVTTAADADEALAAIASSPPDLLVSDIGLPGVDGYELLRRIRAGEQSARVPAIALTAFARSVDRTRALAAGYQSHLAKPVEPDELIATVASFASLLRERGEPAG